jgi:hypothetical protein
MTYLGSHIDGSKTYFKNGDLINAAVYLGACVEDIKRAVVAFNRIKNDVVGIRDSSAAIYYTFDSLYKNVKDFTTI